MAFTLRSFVLSVLALVFTLSTMSEARRIPKKNIKSVNLAHYKPTLSNGSQSLTGPSHDLKLKAITLGHGTQNYTCDYGSPAPVAVGAKAELLDASALLPLLPKNEATQILNQLPGYLANYNFDMIENSTIPVIGTHIFTADKVPYFFLGKLGILGGKKAEAIAAPSTGKDVDWLKLEAITGSVGLTTVYRLATAKGVPPKTCVGQPKDILVPYAAQYWFYG